MHVAVNLKYFLINLKAVTYNGNIFMSYVLLGVIMNGDSHRKYNKYYTCNQYVYAWNYGVFLQTILTQ